METQETIIYRLVMSNHSFGPYLQFSIYWALHGPKNGRGPTSTHMGRGYQNPTEKLTHWVELLSTPLSRNLVSDILGTTPPH